MKKNVRNRKTTQRQQAAAAGKSVHPRAFARGIIHDRLYRAGASGVNKVLPGTMQSNFAKHWRDEAEAMFAK